MTVQEAFKMGYRDAKRIKLELLPGEELDDLSPRDASEMHPHTLDEWSLENAYINGWTDFMHGDSWRYDRLLNRNHEKEPAR